MRFIILRLFNLVKEVKIRLIHRTDPSKEVTLKLRFDATNLDEAPTHKFGMNENLCQT